MSGCCIEKKELGDFMNSKNFKLKLLYVLDIFMKETNENQPVTASDIIRKLEHRGIEASRRSIYDDIEILTEFGLDIIKVEGNKGWYLGVRDFELPEIKLLIDAVKTAIFIPENKSNILINKLENLTCYSEAKELSNHTLLGSEKTNSKYVYYSIDTIHRAISLNHMVSFQYGIWDAKKNYVKKRNSKTYKVSPWCFVMDNNQYYMLAYDDDISGIKHFLVEHIIDAKIIADSKRNGKDYFDKYKLKLKSKMFGMFDGEDVNVVLKCGEKIANIIVDKFGENVTFIPVDEHHFQINVKVSISKPFFGWLLSMGTHIEILQPVEVKDEYTKFLKTVLNLYEK